MASPGLRLPLAIALCAGLGIACQSHDGAGDESGAAKQPGGGQDAPADDSADEHEPAPDEGETLPAGDESELAADDSGEEIDEGPKVPPDYGVFKFPEEPPSDEELTLRGLAGYEVVAVYASPDKESTHLGFLRVGTRLRVGEKIKTDDCPKGWHELEGGGYACASRGLVVDERDPFASYEPEPPAIDEPFPYGWAYVRQWNTPMWYRVPTREELAATHEQRAILEAERTGEPLPGSEPKAGGAQAEGGGDESGESAGGVDSLPPPEGEEQGGGDGADEPAAGDEGGDEPPDDASIDPDAGPEEEEEEPIKLPLSPAHPWLEKGYFVSIGESLREEGRSYWRTARGGIVEKSNAYTYEPKDFQGAVISEEMSFPVGFVMAKNGTKLLRLGDDDKLHATGKQLDKRTFLNLGEEVEISGHAYFTVLPLPQPGSEPKPKTEPEPDPGEGDAAEGGETTGEGGEQQPLEEALLVKADIMRLPDLQPMPKGLDPWDRWIDVDLTKQMLVAYEGSRPVYVTLVSTGKKGSPEEPFETPTGRFRIYSKQITSNMDGATATDGNYAIQDVPWVMYFKGSYALHGAFWHRSFGYVRSHGCVNLGPSDARHLFYWTTPFTPERWHGVTASDENPGTTVIIRES